MAMARIPGVLLSDNLTWTEKGFIEGSMQSTMGIEEASATKDEVVEDAAEEAAQAEGIIPTLHQCHTWRSSLLEDFVKHFWICFKNVNTIDMDDTV